MKTFDKRALVAALIEQIDVELATTTRIALDAAAATSHEENRAEGNKDMRSTETSYLARGQADRAVELERSRERLKALELRDFAEDGSIESGALVRLQQGKQASWFFVLPVAGGRKVDQNGTTVSTITPTSPLGSALLGLGVGDEAEVPTPSAPKIYEVLELA